VHILRDSLPKKENSVIIYFHSCRSKPIRLLLICKTQIMIFFFLIINERHRSSKFRRSKKVLMVQLNPSFVKRYDLFDEQISFWLFFSHLNNNRHIHMVNIAQELIRFVQESTSVPVYHM